MRRHNAVTVVCLSVVLAYAKQLESLLTKKIEAMTVLRGQLLHAYVEGFHRSLGRRLSISVDAQVH